MYCLQQWGNRNEPALNSPKAGLHLKKLMLYIWWEWKGIVFSKLYPQDHEKRHGLASRKSIFDQDKAKRHVTLQTELGRMSYYIHSTHLILYLRNASLFWSLLNSLNMKEFNSLESCKSHLGQVISQNDAKFWEDRIVCFKDGDSW